MKKQTLRLSEAFPIDSYRNRFNTIVEKVELATVDGEIVDGEMVYRLTFHNLILPGYLIVEDKDGKDEGYFIHHCEHNHAGKSCIHLGAAVVFAEYLKIPLTNLSVQADPENIQNYPVANLPISLLEYREVSGINIGSSSSPKKETPTASSLPATTTPPTTSTNPQNWKKGWNEVEDYLKLQGFSRGLIGSVQEKRKHISNSVSLQTSCMPPVRPSFAYEGPILARAVRHVISGRDLLLVGGKGTGKDTLCSTLSWLFNLPLLLVTGNADETRESVVGGPGFKNNQTVYERSPFTECLEQGGLTHYAELNMMDGDVTSIFHSVLDENRVLPTPDGAIKRHPHHLYIGSINLGEGYAGVKPLNDALKDRVAVIHLPYTQDFRGMIERKTGVTSSSILSFLCSVRDAIKRLISEENQGNSADTIRGYIAAAEHLQQFGTSDDLKAEAIEDFIINRVEDLDERMAVRHAVRLAWNDFPLNEEEHNYEGGL